MFYNTDATIKMLRNRYSFLMAKNPVGNEKICKKLARRIRALEQKV